MADVEIRSLAVFQLNMPSSLHFSGLPTALTLLIPSISRSVAGDLLLSDLTSWTPRQNFLNNLSLKPVYREVFADNIK